MSRWKGARPLVTGLLSAVVLASCSSLPKGPVTGPECVPVGDAYPNPTATETTLYVEHPKEGQVFPAIVHSEEEDVMASLHSPPFTVVGDVTNTVYLAMQLNGELQNERSSWKINSQSSADWRYCSPIEERFRLGPFQLPAGQYQLILSASSPIGETAVDTVNFSVQ